MSAIWFTIIIISALAIITKNPENLLPAFLTGTENGVNLAFMLLPVYIVWSALLSVMDSSGLSEKVAKILSPITKRLFPNESEETRKYVTLNFSANLLGAGGAATPLGIRAIESMNKGKNYATPSMILFTVINTTSIQLIPTTVISLLVSNGATDAYSIILPTLIISTLSTLLAVLIWSIIYHKKSATHKRSAK